MRSGEHTMPRTAALVLFCLAALVASPVSAAITDVPSGGTVFIGEQGLNIAATNVTPGSQIALFGGGGNVQTDAPSEEGDLRSRGHVGGGDVESLLADE